MRTVKVKDELKRFQKECEFIQKTQELKVDAVIRITEAMSPVLDSDEGWACDDVNPGRITLVKYNMEDESAVIGQNITIKYNVDYYQEFRRTGVPNNKLIVTIGHRAPIYAEAEGNLSAARFYIEVGKLLANKKVLGDLKGILRDFSEKYMDISDKLDEIRRNK